MKPQRIFEYIIPFFLIYFIWKYFLSQPKPEKDKENKEIKEIEELETTQIATYSNSVYYDFASRIEEAGWDLGTNESAIYSVFRKLMNDLDFLKLKNAFGTRTIRDWGIPRKYTLSSYLESELASGEIDVINNILRNKGIKNRV
jgi:hypothetical protein